MNAFLTGSRAYGTPREDSDIDLVVMMTAEQLDQLVGIISKDESNDTDATYDDSSGTACLRFGSLNLLVVTRIEDYEAWHSGTLELIARKPVTRDEAVTLFQAKREAANAKRTADEGENLAQIDAIAAGYEDSPVALNREDAAIDALIVASFHQISEGDELIALDDPAILSDEDRAAIDALGDDLVDRLIERAKS